MNTYIRYQYNPQKLKNNIRKMRQFRNMTQEKLAQKIGVTRPTINVWEKESSKKIPTIEHLVAICEALDCSVDYLLGSVDSPEIESISKAALYSNIEPEIIRRSLENDEFNCFLNFFMHPKNSGELFNKTKLCAWKKYWADSSIKEINGELLEEIETYYDEYISITPIDEINTKSYTKFIKSKFPKEKITLETKKTDSGLNIKKSVSLLTYQNFFSNENFNYTKFIMYIVQHTFEPLSHRVWIDIQKEKLAKDFVELFTKYLNE